MISKDDKEFIKLHLREFRCFFNVGVSYDKHMKYINDYIIEDIKLVSNNSSGILTNDYYCETFGRGVYLYLDIYHTIDEKKKCFSNGYLYHQLVTIRLEDVWKLKIKFKLQKLSEV